MTYDQRCYDLALVFLEDEGLTERQKHHWADMIAQDIQSAIEVRIEDVRADEYHARVRLTNEANHAMRTGDVWED